MKNKNQMDIKVRFGIGIRKRRYELGISQEELANRSGLHRTCIGDIERGVTESFAREHREAGECSGDFYIGFSKKWTILVDLPRLSYR
jgi:DNA-binding XRE family transcriptional regulator